MKKLVCILASLVLAGAAFAKSSGVALATDTYLRQDKGHGGVEWVLTVPCGTVLELDSENVYNMTLIAGSKKTDNVEFYKVQYEGKSYYVSAKQIASSGTPGVIKQDTVIFAKPSISSFKNAELEFASIVAVGPKVNFSGIDFTEVQYYSESSWSTVKVYVLSSDVSSNANDVKAVMVVNKIASTKDENTKKALIKSAVSLKTSEEITAYVKDVSDEIQGVKKNDKLINSELSSEYEDSESVLVISTGDGSKLNVRSEPKTGDVVAQLEDGTYVRISRVTDNTETVDGITDSWVKITTCGADGEIADDAVSGWVFGGFVSK